MATLSSSLIAQDSFLHGIIAPEALYVSVLGSLGATSILGLLIHVLETIQANAPKIFPNPSTSGMASVILTLVLDLLRSQVPADASTPTSA